MSKTIEKFENLNHDEFKEYYNNHTDIETGKRFNIAEGTTRK